MCRYLTGEVIVIRYQHIAGCQSLYSYILNVHSIGADGNSDPTCAHHAITNIFEEARKAMDGVLKAMMNITEELATLDVGKIKIFGRTWAGSRPPSAL